MNRFMGQSNTTVSRPTLADVAKRLGVSKSAVSQAMNWEPGRVTTVKLETRERILRAVQEMGYRPSWRGQLLAKQRSQTIAVVYSAPLGAVPRGVYLEIVDHIEMQLGKMDLCPTFLHIKDRSERFDRLMEDARFDGCLTLGLLSSEVLDVLRKNRMPTVLVNSDADQSWTHVHVNDQQGTRLLMQHLLSLGHKRIVYHAGANPPPHSSAEIRCGTYQKCMREAGLVAEEPFVGTTAQLVQRIVADRNPPTAIVPFDHWIAVQLLQELWRKGLRVPDDISVGTFNNAYPVAEVIPPLTTVALPAQQMAEHAVRLLLERIERPETQPQTIMLEESLVVRESTAKSKS